MFADIPPASRERVLPYAALCVVLAVAGLAAVIMRPVAPPPLDATHHLAEFRGEIVEVLNAYWHPRYLAEAAGAILSPLVALGLLFTRTGRRFVRWLGGPYPRAPLLAATAAGAAYIVTDIVTYPLSYWADYLHPRSMGLGPPDVATWLSRRLFRHVPRWALATLAGGVLAAMIARWPRSWHLKATLAAVALAFIIPLAGPVVFDPLVVDHQPLPEGPTRDHIEDILVRAGEPDLPITVGTGGTVSEQGAYVAGVGPSRQLVVSPELLEDFSPRFAGVVVGHEIGHVQHRDIERRSLATAATVLLALLIARRLMGSDLVRRRLEPRSESDPRLMPLIVMVAVVGIAVATPASNLNNRAAERAADHVSVLLTEDPASTAQLLRFLTVAGLQNPDPPRWYRVTLASYPPLSDRIRVATDFAQRHDLELPSREEIEQQERDYLHPALERVVGGAE